jgi:hypothetical protein
MDVQGFSSEALDFCEHLCGGVVLDVGEDDVGALSGEMKYTISVGTDTTAAALICSRVVSS